METVETSMLKKQQESLRNKMWRPAERWQVQNESLDWGSRQKTVPRSTPASRIAEQRKKIARLNA